MILKKAGKGGECFNCEALGSSLTKSLSELGLSLGTPFLAPKTRCDELKTAAMGLRGESRSETFGYYPTNSGRVRVLPKPKVAFFAPQIS